MKKMRRAVFLPLLSIVMAGAAYAAPDSAKPLSGKASAEELCPVDVKFKSRVDEKLNALSLEDLTAAANKGNTDAMVLLGLRYTSGELLNYEKAVPLFRAAADKKNADGEFYMAVAYQNGFGVPKDEAQAAAWFRRSADHNHPVGQYWFGEYVAKGRGGLTADWKAALPYFKKAAHGAVADALVEIAIMFNQGHGGLPVDYEKSAACNRVARSLGSHVAQYNIGLMVDQGLIKWQPGDPKPADAPAVSVEPTK